jgi:hypothetical protein
MNSRTCDDTLVKINGPVQRHMLRRDLQVVGLRGRVRHSANLIRQAVLFTKHYLSPPVTIQRGLIMRLDAHEAVYVIIRLGISRSGPCTDNVVRVGYAFPCSTIRSR